MLEDCKTTCCSADPEPEVPSRNRARDRRHPTRAQRALRDRDDWVTRLTDVHRQGRLPQELARLRRHGPIIVDDIGYLSFEQDAANSFFQLVSSRYERLTDPHQQSPISGGAVFGDQAVAAAMLDRIVHPGDP
jgi:hypothetical protein